MPSPFQIKGPEYYEKARQERIEWRTVTHEDPMGSEQELRDALQGDLGSFLKTCFPQAYVLDFSDDHFKIIDALQRAIEVGQKKAIAMPRGSGKTTMCTHAALYSLLYGYRKYLFVVCADQGAAKSLIASAKAELLYNEKLHELFPEVTTYFRSTEGNALRARNQLNEEGNPTGIETSIEKLVFPWVPDSISAGAVVESAGITGRIRGARHARIDGTITRPDIVLIDDPQTKESAKSPTQTEDRLNIIRGDVLGLSGPNANISCMVACTVIQRDDLASQLLDRKEMPEFRGDKCKLVYEWPKNQELWDKYMEMYREENYADEDHSKSLALYKKNRKKMDEGAVCGWPDRYVREDQQGNPVELSALQHAYNLLIENGEEAFNAEYQNDPTVADASEYTIDANLVASRVNGVPRLNAPIDAHIITTHTDVNYRGLHWSVVAHTMAGTAYIIDYGKYPEGDRKSLISEDETKNMSEQEIDAKIFEGLTHLHRRILLKREYMREGQRAAIDFMGVDASYRMRTVVDWCQAMRLSGMVVVPTVGRAQKNYKPTHVIGNIGNAWHATKMCGKIKAQAIWYDADLWRERMQRAFLQQPGGPGSISLHGKEPIRHKEIARQLSAEQLVEKIEGEVHTHYTWQARPGSIWDYADTVMVNLVLGAAKGAGPYRVGAYSKKPRRKKKKARISSQSI